MTVIVTVKTSWHLGYEQAICYRLIFLPSEGGKELHLSVALQDLHHDDFAGISPTLFSPPAPANVSRHTRWRPRRAPEALPRTRRRRTRDDRIVRSLECSPELETATDTSARPTQTTPANDASSGPTSGWSPRQSYTYIDARTPCI